MENVKNNYSFKLKTKNVGNALMEVCSISLFCDIPLEFTKIVIADSEGNQISFRLFMNIQAKDMIARIFFQKPGITEMQMFRAGKWQTLENPFSLNVDDKKINVQKRKHDQGMN